MNVTKETTAQNKVKLTIELSSEEFEAGMAAAYRKVVKQINIPGFRKGKAPRKVIETYYGESVFYEEAFNYAFPKAYDQAVEEQNLFPVEQPEIDIVSIGTKEKTVFTAEFFVKPEVTLGQYKDIEVVRNEYPVTAEQVDADIEQTRNRNASWEEVDRACTTDDRVTIDYAGTINGEAFEGGSSENYPLVLGSGNFIPGFEEQIVGMEKGQEKDIVVTFPEDYRVAELAGKEAHFHVRLNGVQARNLPELDDEFAKDVSEFDTLADYRADVEKRLTEQSQTRTDTEFTNAVVEAVCANAQVDIPQPMVDRELDAIMRDMQMRFAYQGLSMDDYFKYTGQTADQLRAQNEPQALSRVKAELVLEAIRKAENIEATQEDVDALVKKYAAQSNLDAESFTKSFTDQDWDYIRGDAAVEKTIEFLKAQAKPVAAKETEAQA